MITHVAHVALLVRDYQEALDFYCGKLGFRIAQDIDLGTKRWLLIQAEGGTQLLLSKAEDPQQVAAIGQQGAGKVWLFFQTDDFEGDFREFKSRGVEFIDGPRYESYGSVAVFQDLYGNRIDLIQRN